MLNPEPIIVAQVGCGYWGPNLLRNFSSVEGCRVKYVVDQDERRRRFAESSSPGVKGIVEMEEALADSEVQAVIIATPAGTHFDLGRRALAAGKHILVEKPLAMSVSEVDELERLSRPKGLKVMAAHTYIYHEAVKYLKDLIDRKALGRIYCVYTQRLNLGVVRSDVNALWNLAPHDVSILCHLLNGAPHSVQATGTAFLRPPIEDVVFMNLRFAGEVHANVHVSWLDPNKTRKVTIVGEKKMVVYDDMADDKITIYDRGVDFPKLKDKPFDLVEPYKPVYRAGDITIPKVPFREPLRVEAEHFLECIRNNEEPRTGYTHARAVVLALEQADQTMKAAASLSSRTAAA
jgi:predicted dehydrogenase